MYDDALLWHVQFLQKVVVDPEFRSGMTDILPNTTMYLLPSIQESSSLRGLLIVIFILSLTDVFGQIELRTKFRRYEAECYSQGYKVLLF
jgi:hypothetical protein